MREEITLEQFQELQEQVLKMSMLLVRVCQKLVALEQSYIDGGATAEELDKLYDDIMKDVN